MSKKPQAGSSTAYTGTQIASFDLRRTTTQTAIQMAMVLGRGASKDRVFSRIESLRSAAQGIFHGCLQKPLMFQPNVVLVDETKASVANRWKSKVPNGDNLKDNVDLVLSPLDGGHALLEGRSGAMTSIAACKPNILKNPFAESPGEMLGSYSSQSLELAKKEFLVVVISQKWANRIGLSGLESSVLSGRQNSSKRCSLENYIATMPLIDLILKGFERRRHFPTVGMTFSDNSFKSVKYRIKGYHMRRELTGSTVTSAIGALVGNLSLAVSGARLTHVIQAAIAVAGLGGQLFAIPLTRKKRDDGKMSGADLFIESGTPILTERDFLDFDSGSVTNRLNAVLVATSISEVCLQDRVRFGNHLHVDTNTVIVSAATGRYSNIQDTFQLDLMNMTNSDGKSLPALDHLRGFAAEYLDEKAVQLFKPQSSAEDLAGPNWRANTKKPDIG